MSAEPLQEALDDVSRRVVRHLRACAQCRSHLGEGFEAKCPEGQRLIRAAVALIPWPEFRKAGGR